MILGERINLFVDFSFQDFPLVGWHHEDMQEIHVFTFVIGTCDIQLREIGYHVS